MEQRSDCAQCILRDRRSFLRETAGAAIAVLAAMGLRGVGGPRYPVPATDGVQIDRDNQVILVRWQSAIYAFNLSCPHQNTALRWDGADGWFQCPKHHSKYRPDGTFIEGRATRNMDRFTVQSEGDMIAVDVDAMHKSDEDQATWASAVVRL